MVGIGLAAAFGQEPAAASAPASEPVVATVEVDGQRWVLRPGGVVELPDGTRVVVPGAVGLFHAGGRTWVEVAETKAVPLSEAPGGPAPASAPEARTAPARAPATVVRVDRGAAIVDQGREHGLAVGDPVRVLGEREMRLPSVAGGMETRKVERVVATGRVGVVEEDRAVVDLARGGRVAAGDRVEAKPGAYRYPVAPERLPGIREAGVVLRPLLALDTVGVAMVNEAWLTVTATSPWYAQARLAPIGLGWSADGNAVTVAALASGGYESRYFAVGLGAGWSMLNSDPGASELDRGMLNAEDLAFTDVDSAFAFVQEARLGARDGVHVGVRNTLLLVPTLEYEWTYEDDEESLTVTDRRREFVFGGIAMDLQVPTGDRTDLFVDWGTGRAGATWVEGGVSSWVRGNGDAGSLGLRVGAGYASLYGRPEDRTIQLYGPMVSVGGRWRF
ncbi:MAG: hypothetical protein ACOZNI_05600 [Myxococcota bacterium]